MLKWCHLVSYSLDCNSYGLVTDKGLRDIKLRFLEQEKVILICFMPSFVLEFAEFAMVGRWLSFGHCAQNVLQEERFSGDAKICTVIWKL